MLQVAIIGSGPSGCYLADALARQCPESKIDVFDRLPTPFGLVRYGVAPDHQRTKQIERQLASVFNRENVTFVGNIEIGRDISVDELQQHYDLVILATGAFDDRQPPIDGLELNGCYGAAELVGWYNAHPDHQQAQPAINDTVAIIGAGNVALDLARTLLTGSKHSVTDIAVEAASTLERAAVKTIHIIARSPAQYAKFTSAELKELAELEDVCFKLASGRIPNPADLSLTPNADRNLKILQQAFDDPEDASTEIHFHFDTSPLEIIGDNQVEVLRVQHGSDESDLQVGTIVTATGFTTRKLNGVPYDAERGTFAHDNGFIGNNLYCVGWCKRGPQGVIPANRADAMQLAKQLAEQTTAADKPGYPALGLNGQASSFADWTLIDQHEKRGACDQKPRKKLPTVEKMLRVIGR